MVSLMLVAALTEQGLIFFLSFFLVVGRRGLVVSNFSACVSFAKHKNVW